MRYFEVLVIYNVVEQSLLCNDVFYTDLLKYAPRKIAVYQVSYQAEQLNRRKNTRTHTRVYTGFGNI